MLGALLPADVTVSGVRRAPIAFHPRYAARYREYRYTVWNGPRSPLRERTALGKLPRAKAPATVLPAEGEDGGGEGKRGVEHRVDRLPGRVIQPWSRLAKLISLC